MIRNVHRNACLIIYPIDEVRGLDLPRREWRMLKGARILNAWYGRYACMSLWKSKTDPEKHTGSLCDEFLPTQLILLQNVDILQNGDNQLDYKINF